MKQVPNLLLLLSMLSFCIQQSSAMVEGSNINEMLNEWTLGAVKDLHDNLPQVTQLITEKHLSPEHQEETRHVSLNTKSFGVPNYLKKFPSYETKGYPTYESSGTFDKFISKKVWKNLFSPDNFVLLLVEAYRALKPDDINSLKDTEFLQKAQAFPKNTNLNIIGDLHGGFHDVLPFFNQQELLNEDLTVKDQNQHYGILGDMVDSGPYSLETLTLLLVLYLKNQHNVHFVRGNHEQNELNKEYGFFAELKFKFPSATTEQLSDIKDKLKQFYSVLPVLLLAIYKETKYVKVLCHGGVDHLDTMEEVHNLFKSVVEGNCNKAYRVQRDTFGLDPSRYNWNTFCIHPKEKSIHSRRGFGFQISKKDYEKWITACVGGEKYGYNGDVTTGHAHSLNFSTDLMPLFFATYYIAYLWTRQSPKVFTLCFNPGSSAGVSYKDQHYTFPGVMTSTICVVSEGGTCVEMFRLPNMHISPEIKDKHCKMLASCLFTSTRKENDNFETIREHFGYYAEAIKSESTFDTASQEELEQFLKIIVDVNEPERIVQWKWNGNSMQLVKFFLPKLLQEFCVKE